MSVYLNHGSNGFKVSNMQNYGLFKYTDNYVQMFNMFKCSNIQIKVQIYRHIKWNCHNLHSTTVITVVCENSQKIKIVNHKQVIAKLNAEVEATVILNPPFISYCIAFHLQVCCGKFYSNLKFIKSKHTVLLGTLCCFCPR